MEKTFKLPQEFITKWIEALRSDNYAQGIEQLCTDDADYTGNGPYSYCCLGVALKIYGVDNLEMGTLGMPGEVISYPLASEIKFPLELMKNNFNDFELTDILAKLNDGYTSEAYDRMLKKYPLLEIKLPPANYEASYTFSEIADFIEANVEPY